MKKIGQGLQFNVYESQGKVIKYPTTKRQIKIKLLIWNPSYFLRPSSLEKESENVMRERRVIIQEIQNRNINRAIFADLCFSENKIEQEKVIPLRKKLGSCDGAKKWIDKYIRFIFECWKNGFSERTYNLTINNGVNSVGKIVLFDFGELTFKKLCVEKAIIEKKWRRSYSFKRELNGKIKEYYDNQMLKKLTLSNLNRYWEKFT